ncbi:MAG TPA: hypothetical protein VHA12_01025 [Candidatus Nanoarchaeia archaeon]|nr:hypothetical protein [Candidatus Nanoarchaeia archaeon]
MVLNSVYFQNLVQECKLLNKDSKMIIWITGEIGAGKSFWADYLSYYLGKSSIRCSVIRIDDFLLDRRIRARSNKIYNLRLLNQLYNLRRLKYINHPLYNYKTGRTLSIHKNFLEKVIIIEGSLLVENDLNKFVDKLIYVESSALSRLFRILLRDSREKKYSFLDILRKIVKNYKVHRELVGPIKQSKNTHLIHNTSRQDYPKIISEAHKTFSNYIDRSVSTEVAFLQGFSQTIDKKQIYQIITRAVDLLPFKYSKIIKNACIVSRGTLARDELRSTSDWDISIIFEKVDKLKEKAATKYFNLIRMIKNNSSNTGGIVDLSTYDNPYWDREEIVHSGLLTSEYICGKINLFNRLQVKVKSRNKNHLHSFKIYQQYLLKDKIFSHNDLKNYVGGVRDFHQISWFAQMAYNWTNMKTFEVFNKLYIEKKISFFDRVAINALYTANKKNKFNNFILRKLNYITCARIFKKIIADVEKKDEN